MDFDDRPSMNGERWVPSGLSDELLVMAREGRLAGIRRTRLELVRDWLDRGASAEETCKRLTLLNRDVVRAVLEAHALEYPWLRECTFLEFGSGGRGEHVPGSDQDNGLLIPVPVDSDEVDDCTQSIVLALDGSGLALCEGGVMVSNPEWRGDFDTWLERLTSWLANPAEKGPWQSGLILDFKALFGAEDEVRRMRERLWEYVRTKPIALSLLIRELTDYRLPLTFFGAFVTEREGRWQGFLNIKNSVLAHLTNSARILSLKHDVHPANTCERIRALAEKGHVSDRHGQALLDGWEYLQRKRLEIGLACDREGIPPHNYVNPAALDNGERQALKDAIHAVEKLVRLVQAGTGL
ncbi:MAG: putative nucleotidyltransferase substrate binding domain-containing protein [Pseudodesulfovibrio sp.]|uniref:putative nucleotidyltransferase substrate binding domain-containing protein n=1 Tax=Pseudodesulfovibrio sp. TaxID=2035812 RepID=UPI003D14FF0A